MRNLAERFLLAIPVSFLGSMVPVNDAIFCVSNDDRVGRQVEQPGLFSQTPLRLFLFGDIARNFGDADNFPVLILDRRNSQRDVD